MPNNVKTNGSVSFTMRVPVGIMDKVRADIEETGDYTSIAGWFNAAALNYLRVRQKDRSGGGGVTSSDLVAKKIDVLLFGIGDGSATYGMLSQTPEMPGEDAST